MLRTRSLGLAGAIMLCLSSTVLAQALRVVPNEPGPGSLQGTSDCVLVTGGNTKASLCPKSKYMKVCGAPDANTNRRRTCVSG